MALFLGCPFCLAATLFSRRLESLLILTQSDQGKSHYLQKSVAKHVVFLFDKNRIIGSKYIIFNEKGNFIKLSFIKFPVNQAESTSVYVKIGVQCSVIMCWLKMCMD